MKVGQKTKPVQETPFQTIRSTVRTTGLPEHMLRSMQKSGELPCIMSGNRCLVNVPQLMEIMNKKTAIPKK